MTRDNSKQEEELIRQKATVIMQVRSGQMSAKEGARQLGVSRKTFYGWEKKGLQGLMEALSLGQAGRPKKVIDPQKESLKAENAALKKQLVLAQLKLNIQEVLRDTAGCEPLKKKQE